MVDFATEQVISPQRLAKKLGVSTDTIRRWFRQGLESRKLCGKRFTSLEALNRFSGEPHPSVHAKEVEDAMEGLRRLGVNVGKESCRDDRSGKESARGKGKPRPEVHSVQEPKAVQPQGMPGVPASRVG